MSEYLAIETTDDGLILDGELDVNSAAEVEAAIEAVSLTQLSGVLTVYLTKLTFLDSIGLRSLIRAKAHCPAVRFVNPAPQVARIMAVSGVSTLLLADHE